MKTYWECSGVNRSGRMCTRKARYLYLRGDASASLDHVVAAYCAQHNASREPMALLRPFVWQYDRIIDVREHKEVVW